MSFASDNGYIPSTFEEIMDSIRLGVNEQFDTTYTAENFVATNFYKYFYSLVQKVLENETRTSEIFASLQNYIESTNTRIQRPSVSLPGLIDSFADAGYVASVRKMVLLERGIVAIALDLDDGDPEYAAQKLEVCNLIKDFICAGITTFGSETETIVLSNGQSFDFSFSLPNPTPVLLRLTLTISENQLATIPSDEDIRTLLFDNINDRYRLGWDFEPQRYFNQADDASWAASILLEWSDDGGSTYYPDIFTADFDDLFTFGLDDIEVVIE